MVRIELDWKMCPDGVEVLETRNVLWGLVPDVPEIGRAFRYRSDHREPIRFKLEARDSPLILQLANIASDFARGDLNTENRLAVFFAKNGLVVPEALLDLLPERALPANAALGYCVACLDIIQAAGSDTEAALKRVNDLFSHWNFPRDWTVERWLGSIGREETIARGSRRGSTFMTPMQLSVALSRSAPKGHKTGTPILSLQPSGLGDFIALEGARIVIDGAQYRTCDHCGKGFLTGHGTGRRSTARFHSDLCRQRSRRQKLKAPQRRSANA